jgi:metal-sulfur cluster biosynthetic enzyme
MEAALLSALRTIIDPELQLSIVELGLVYDHQFDPATKTAQVLMTLTTPTCPLQEHFREQITHEVMKVPGIDQVEVTFTFTPRWSAHKASDSVKQHFALLGIPIS